MQQNCFTVSDCTHPAFSGTCYEYNPSPEGDFGGGRSSYSSVNSRNSGGLQPPTIISRGETIRAAIGERVVLPCQVKNLGEKEGD